MSPDAVEAPPVPQTETPQARRDRLTRRRAIVARLRLAGQSQEQIRAALAIPPPDGPGIVVSHGTVVNDLNVIRTGWQQEMTSSYEAHCSKQLAIIDALLGRATSEGLQGSPRHMEAAARLLRERARLLGLDSPTRVQLQVEVRQYESKLDQEIGELLSLFPGAPALEAASTVVAEVPVDAPAPNGSG